MNKVSKHLTLEPKTVEIIKRIAEEEKRKENSVVDMAVQAYAAKKKAADN